MTQPARTRSLALLVGLALAVGACGAPVGVKRADPRTVHRMLTSNVLTSGGLSTPTENVLQRRGLYDRFARDPEGTLADLHTAVATGRGGRDDVAALAELSFFHAEATGKRSYYLASVVYAYAFLFPGPGHHAPEPLDPRLRLAADVYNRGIREGFATPNGGEVDVRGGSYPLPFGTLDVAFDASTLRWGTRTLDHFVPVADLKVTGMATRYRWPGIGAPLAASTEPIDAAAPSRDFVEPWAKVPVTAVLRIAEPRQQLAEKTIRATLTLDATMGPSTTTIDGQPVPLEIESTASLAYTLAESPVWAQEIKGFLENVGVVSEKTRLAALSPYVPGKMPVVLVHGTVSSAGRWAEMLNELENDPRIHDRYQFWLFSYDTGNPVPYSAMLLRQALTQAIVQLDPEGKDPALREMTVIGHSQGGLLTKMTAIDSGSVLWEAVSRQPLAKLTLTERSRTMLQGMLFLEPLPFVRRVIFIATPQRGSYFAGSWLAHQAARLITLPVDVAHLGTDLLRQNKEAIAFTATGDPPTSVDSMTPGRPFIKALASLPVAPGVDSHSIIPVQQEGDPLDGDDGIVRYDSAHIDPVDSELIVRSGHSCQSHPLVIEEVRRILLAGLTP